MFLPLAPEQLVQLLRHNIYHIVLAVGCALPVEANTGNFNDLYSTSITRCFYFSLFVFFVGFEGSQYAGWISYFTVSRRREFLPSWHSQEQSRMHVVFVVFIQTKLPEQSCFLFIKTYLRAEKYTYDGCRFENLFVHSKQQSLQCFSLLTFGNSKLYTISFFSTGWSRNTDVDVSSS